MPKVSKKAKATEEPVFDNPSFPDIETTGEENLADSGDNKAKKGQDDGQAALLATLQQQVAGLISSNEELKRTNMALMSAAPTDPGGGTGGAPAKLDLTGLPDPGLDPEGYATAVAQRTSAFVSAQQDANMRANSQRNQAEGRVQTLWNDFSRSYEDYADVDKIDYVAQKVVSDMKARGVDPEKYMFGAKETFFNDVVKKYDEIFGKPNAEGDTDEGTGATDNTPAQRTGGIFGGLESGGGRSDSSEEPKGDMLADIQARQRKSGFY